MKEIKNFELIDESKNFDMKIIEVTEADPAEKSILDLAPSKWETIWNVSLILTAYIGMGILLAGRLILDIVNYLMTLL